jgi:hypothetical protein
MWLMPIGDSGGTTARSHQLSQIERLLEEYRATKDRRLLRRAIELWDEAEAAYKLRTETIRATRFH